MAQLLNGEPTVQFTARLPTKLAEKLMRLAKKDRRTRNAQLIIAVEEHVAAAQQEEPAHG